MSNNSTVPVPVKRPAPDIEHNVQLTVTPSSTGGFEVMTSGMQSCYNKPELHMHVPEGIYLNSACRIVNDCARYLAERKNTYHNGQRVQLGPWTVVELTDRPDGTVAVADGTEMEILKA